MVDSLGIRICRKIGREGLRLDSVMECIRGTKTYRQSREQCGIRLYQRNRDGVIVGDWKGEIFRMLSRSMGIGRLEWDVQDAPLLSFIGFLERIPFYSVVHNWTSFQTSIMVSWCLRYGDFRYSSKSGVGLQTCFIALGCMNNSNDMVLVEKTI